MVRRWPTRPIVATLNEIAEALTFTPQNRGGMQRADDIMARITAARHVRRWQAPPGSVVTKAHPAVSSPPRRTCRDRRQQRRRFRDPGSPDDANVADVTRLLLRRESRRDDLSPFCRLSAENDGV